MNAEMMGNAFSSPIEIFMSLVGDMNKNYNGTPLTKKLDHLVNFKSKDIEWSLTPEGLQNWETRYLVPFEVKSSISYNLYSIVRDYIIHSRHYSNEQVKKLLSDRNNTTFKESIIKEISKGVSELVLTVNKNEYDFYFELTFKFTLNKFNYEFEIYTDKYSHLPSKSELVVSRFKLTKGQYGVFGTLGIKNSNGNVNDYPVKNNKLTEFIYDYLIYKDGKIYYNKNKPIDRFIVLTSDIQTYNGNKYVKFTAVLTIDGKNYYKYINDSILFEYSKIAEKGQKLKITKFQVVTVRTNTKRAQVVMFDKSHKKFYNISYKYNDDSLLRIANFDLKDTLEHPPVFVSKKHPESKYMIMIIPKDDKLYFKPKELTDNDESILNLEKVNREDTQSIDNGEMLDEDDSEFDSDSDSDSDSEEFEISLEEVPETKVEEVPETKVEEVPETKTQKRRGRPVGSKNKSKTDEC